MHTIWKSIWLILAFTFVLSAQQVEITAMEMSATQMSKEIHFIGSAKVVQGDDWILADEIVVYFDENNQTKSYQAKGHVRFELKEGGSHYKGKAQKVTFYPQKSLYKLQGNAVIDDLLENRHIVAERITLDVKTGKASVVGKKKRPVKFIFDTEQK